MNRKRIIPAAGVALLAGILLYGWYRLPASRDAADPLRREVVLPTSEFVNVEASVGYYRERILKQPDVARHYVALAQVYLQQARASADEARYVPLARALLDEALRRAPDDYHALLLQAALLNTLHRFEEARDLARRLSARHPSHAYPYGILVDALVELGDYEAAVAACDTMLSLRPDLASYARAAYLRELHGDLPGAVEAMMLAADAGVAGREDRSWALYQLGLLYLKQADVATARRVFEGLLEERPGYPFGLAGLARVWLAEGQPGRAARLLEAAAETAGGAFLEEQIQAYEALGDAARLAAAQDRLSQAYRDAAAGGENVRMELADFLADAGLEPPRALRLARAEYARRPGHLHALETYAWALHKNGRSVEAVPYIERAFRLGTVDPMARFRAGVIYEAAGQPERARVSFEQALAEHLHLESPASAASARVWLERSSDVR